MKIRIVITPEHRRCGGRKCPFTCPVALALQGREDITYASVGTFSTDATLRGEIYSFKHSASLIKFILDHDKGCYAKPGTFYLTRS